MERIAIQGYRGAFHHEATEIHFGKTVELVECDTFEQLVDSVISGRANHGVMAIENSVVGCIIPNFTLLRESGLVVNGEIYLRISQNLMALANQSIFDLQQVQSHSMAIAQCKPFFKQYPHIQLIDSIDTALSAKLISQNHWVGTGTIGSELAASLYGLEIIANSIETNKENFTRFLVISRQANSIPLDVPVKATLAFTARHSPGGLSEILAPLAAEGVNLTMLHSLPMVGSAWEYIFHADLCYCSMQHARSSLVWLSKMVSHLWVMGVYPTDKQSNRN